MVLIVNATGQWSFYSIIQIILIDFSTDFFYTKIFALGGKKVMRIKKNINWG